MSIGKNIKSMRERNGLTQEKLAGMVGVHRSMIMLIETGRKNPSVVLLRDISKVLNCRADDLIEV